MKREICPICKGTGKIGWDNEITCHGCEGEGYIEVPDVGNGYISPDCGYISPDTT